MFLAKNAKIHVQTIIPQMEGKRNMYGKKLQRKGGVREAALEGQSPSRALPKADLGLAGIGRLYEKGSESRGFKQA